MGTGMFFYCSFISNSSLNNYFTKCKKNEFVIAFFCQANVNRPNLKKSGFCRPT